MALYRRQGPQRLVRSREERRAAIDRRLFPLGHWAGMPLERTGDLSHRLRLPQGFKGDPRLDCRVEPASAVSGPCASRLCEEAN